jgi:hypothetical protein
VQTEVLEAKIHAMPQKYSSGVSGVSASRSQRFPFPVTHAVIDVIPGFQFVTSNSWAFRQVNRAQAPALE